MGWHFGQIALSQTGNLLLSASRPFSRGSALGGAKAEPKGRTPALARPHHKVQIVLSSCELLHVLQALTLSISGSVLVMLCDRPPKFSASLLIEANTGD
jgi:hypothetical protein